MGRLVLILNSPSPLPICLSAGEIKMRVCYGGETNALSVDNTEDTASTHVITGGNKVYRVHVGDFNGSGTDIITETASSDSAYRSTVFINRGDSTGFDPMTIQRKLRTYFYIDYQ